MVESFALKPSEVIWWIQHSEYSLFADENGFENIKELLLPENHLTDHENLDDDKSELQVLVQQIQNECKVRSLPYTTFCQYRLQALRGIWNAREQWAREKKGKKNVDEIINDQVERRRRDDFSSESELSLMLIICLLESQAKTDPSLTGITTKLLTDHFRNCKPLSLSPQSRQVKALETLLTSWLNADVETNDGNVDLTATALVSLTCAHHSRSTMLRTIQTLKQLESKNIQATLNVKNALENLLRLEGGHQDSVKAPEVENLVSLFQLSFREVFCDDLHGAKLRSVGCHEGYLYLSNRSGCRVQKVGTGYCGTVKGHIYSTDTKKFCEPGFFAIANSMLIKRSITYDDGQDQRLCKILNPDVLSEETIVNEIPEMAVKVDTTTIHLVSNGNVFYWIRSSPSGSKMSDLSQAGHLIFVDVFEICRETLLPRMTQPRIILNKNPIATLKILQYLAEGDYPSLGDPPASTPTAETTQSSSSMSEPNLTTTCGIELSRLQKSTVYVCQNFITFLVSAETEAIPRFDKQSQIFFPALSFCSKTGFVRQDVGSVLPLYLVNTSTEICATYDPFNHKIWMATKEHVIEFESQGLQGKVPFANCSKPKNAVKETMTLSEVCSGLLQHLTVENFHSQKSKKVPYDKETYLEELKILLDLLKLYMKDDTLNEESLTSLLIIISCSIKRDFPELDVQESKQIFEGLETHLWELIGRHDDPLAEVAVDALSEVLLRLNDSDHQVSNAIANLIGSEDKNRQKVLDNLLGFFEEEIDNPDSPLEILQVQPFNCHLFKKLLKDEAKLVLNSSEIPVSELTKLSTSYPKESVTLKYLTTLLSRLCNKLVSKRDTEAEKIFLEYLNIILNHSNALLEIIHKTSLKIKSQSEQKSEEFSSRKRFLELSLKSSILATILPMMLTVNGGLNRDASVNLIKPLLKLATQCSQITEIFATDSQVFDQLESFPPWTRAIRIETPHPLPESFKMTETVRVSGATKVIIFFDPLCSTLNDFDKLVLSSPTNKRIVEYGGNNYGQGNKRTLSGGWPKSPIVIDGDTITLNFELKSRRDPDTLDKTVWGFRLWIRFKFPNGRHVVTSPFANLLAATAKSFETAIQTSFNGAHKTEEEVECNVLLKSRLLQRCIWRSPSSLDSCLPFFSHSCLSKLKSLGHCKLPVLRSSLKMIICPELIEEKILSVVVKHMGLIETLENFETTGNEHPSDVFILSELVSDVYLKINSLIRRLQALAQLEKQWEEEVEKIRDGDFELKDVFFQDYLHHESKTKELALLCFLKGITIDENSQEQKIMQELKDMIEKEARFSDSKSDFGTTTELIVKGIFARLDLLLRADIELETIQSADPEESQGFHSVMTRSLQSWPEGMGEFKCFKRQPSESGRSVDDSILQIPRLIKNLKVSRGRKSALAALQRELQHEDSGQLNLLDQLFSFIGYRPEEAVSSKSFLRAVAVRRKRSNSRMEALKLMRNVFEAAGRFSWIFLGPMSAILKDGLRVEDLTCGNNLSDAVHEFSLCITNIVKIAKENKEKCLPAVGNLCIIPYRRDEEKSLLQSQLVKFLDQLCGSHDFGSSGTDDEGLSIPRLAWLGFKVIAQRCFAWEDDQDGHFKDYFGRRLQIDPMSLENQVSNLLVNHLAKTSNSGNCALGYEVLQEVLSLLCTLSKSRLGQGILSQPSCVSKLLSLLSQQNLSPKVIMTIIKLSNIALPIMTKDACQQIVLPKNDLNRSVEEKIVNLLMENLTSFLVPESLQCDECEGDDVSSKEECEIGDFISDHPAVQSIETNQTLSLYVHKRKDQNAHEIIQSLLNSACDFGIFSSYNQESMEKVVRLDKEMNKNHRAEVVTNDATIVFRTATRKYTFHPSINRDALILISRMAQQGFVVSVSTQVKHDENNSDTLFKFCKAKNETLAKTDPGRPFISSEVANDLAAEIISLFQNLAKSHSAIPWKETIIANLKSCLRNLGFLLSTAPDSLREDINVGSIREQAGKSVSCLALLGGFTESIKPGLQVHKVGCDNDSPHLLAVVNSTTEEYVNLTVNTNGQPVNMQVPKRKVEIADKLPPESVQLFLGLTSEIIFSLLQVFSNDDQDALSLPLPTCGSKYVLETARLIAEVRTRACQLFSLYMENEEFCNRFLQSSCEAVDLLKYHSKDCLPADKFCCIENACVKLRNLYRDSIKPQRPSSIVKSDSANIAVSWDQSQSYPPLKSILFTREGAAITYLGEPTTSSGLPRGEFVYATSPLTPENNQFEIEIVSLGELVEESGAVSLSIGLAPMSEKNEMWSFPPGSLFLHNNGRAVHYSGSSLLQWRSIRFDTSLNPGDRVRLHLNDQKAFFAINGHEKDQCFEQVPFGLYPVVHIQKKGIRLKANFGIEKSSSVIEQPGVKQTEQSKSGLSPGAGHRRIPSVLGRPALRSKSLVRYNPELWRQYCLPTSGLVTKTGDPEVSLANIDDDSDDESGDDLNDEDVRNRDDMHTSLVRAWETNVFPSIRRRFRNESERRDGLEQIRGALSLGMIEIARQTVEFLYEENGGIPRDLKLPTLEDVKDQMQKLTLEKLKPGQTVEVMSGDEINCSKFMCKPQFRTLGLSGEVVRTDFKNDLVEVETYLKEEGILVSYWYPINFLKKPSESQRRGVKLDSQIHAQLLNNEFALSRLYCRRAYTAILKHSRKEHLPVVFSSPGESLHLNLLLLRDFDYENLTHLVENSMSENMCALVNLHENDLVCEKAETAMVHNTKNILDFFTVDRQLAENEIQTLLDENLLNEDALEQIFACLNSPFSFFTTEEIIVNDVSMLSSLMRFEGSCFSIATCRFDGDTLTPPDELKVQLRSVPPTSPFSTLGHFSTRSTFEWPAESHGLSRDPESRVLPVIIFPSSSIKVNHSGGGDTNILIQIDGIPSQFLIAIAAIEVMLKTKNKTSAMEVYREDLADHLVTFLTKHQLTPVLKELLFHLLAKVLRRNFFDFKMILQPRVEGLLQSFLVEISSLQRNYQSRFIVPTYMQALFELITAWVQTFPVAKEYIRDTFLQEPESVLEILTNSISNQIIYPEMLDEFQQTQVNAKCHTRILIINHIPKHLKPDFLRRKIQSATEKHGGPFQDSIFIPAWKQSYPVGQFNCGFAVMECRAGCKIDDFKSELETIEAFSQYGEFDLADTDGVMPTLVLSKVDANLACLDESCKMSWAVFIKSKLLSEEDVDPVLSRRAVHVLTEMFDGEASIPLSKLSDYKQLKRFWASVAPEGSMDEKLVAEINKEDSQQESGDNEDDPLLRLTSFCKYLSKKSAADPISVMKGFYDSNHDLNMECLPDWHNLSSGWTLHHYAALVKFTNQLSFHLKSPITSLDPTEIYMNEIDFVDHRILHDVSPEELKMRFLILKVINQKVRTLIRLCDFRPDDDEFSVASILSSSQSMLFFDTKSQLLDEIVNANSTPVVDQAPPTVVVDPVEGIGQSQHDIKNTWFYQTMVQLSSVSSLDLCVPLATGADPRYPFLVKMVGENVEGQTGSFRHLLSKLVDELHGSSLSLLMPYIGEGNYKGKYILRPGPVSLLDDDLLQFFGKVIGFGLRSGIPLCLDLVPSFWKSLLDKPVDGEDLSAFDPIVSSYLSKIVSISTQDEFDEFVEDTQFPRFTYPSIRGDDCELLSGGSDTYLSWENRQNYVELVRQFRLDEMRVSSRMIHVRAGLSSIVPWNEIQRLFDEKDIELKVCGQQKVDVESLKKYTIYQVGLSADDHHIKLFWSVLDNFDDQQRQKFVKFACNQDRIPTPKPGEPLPPPYPMKIAPSDKRDDPVEHQNIRVETCMFMIKLPRCTSYDQMKAKLTFAMASAMDPLSG